MRCVSDSVRDKAGSMFEGRSMKDFDLLFYEYLTQTGGKDAHVRRKRREHCDSTLKFGKKVRCMLKPLIKGASDPPTHGIPAYEQHRRFTEMSRCGRTA